MLFKILSIILLVTFYLIYFIKLLFQRRSGIKTNQLGKGNKVRSVIIVEVLLKLSTITIVIIQLISILLNWTFLSNSVRIIGVILSFIGIIVFLLAVYTMKDSWRAGIDTKNDTILISVGIYKISRNPAFLGFDLLYLGMLLIYFNIPLLIITLISIILLHLQILQEEKHLVKAFGDDYINYKKNTYRYIGRKLRLI